MSEHARFQLEHDLGNYERLTTNQIVIAIFRSLDGASLEDFSIRLADTWKIGQKGKGNGIILLIFQDDRKVRIEVGYGLESRLPDIVAHQIIDQVIAPSFRAGRFDDGILGGVAMIVKAIMSDASSDEMKNTAELEQEAAKHQNVLFMKWGAALLLLIVIFDFVRYSAYLGSHWQHSDRYHFIEWWIRFALLLFLLNLIFRILFYSRLSSSGGYYGSRSGYGGFNGGGFSGGGGGGFGGGGASGGW